MLWRAHRGRWLAFFKPFGLELLEMRYGTLRIRIETARDRLKVTKNTNKQTNE